MAAGLVVVITELDNAKDADDTELWSGYPGATPGVGVVVVVPLFTLFASG